jgi:AcrR family transcriptional regulator
VKIVDAAKELLEVTGSSSFTVQEVLERAGTSLQTFYRHFSGKDELMLAVLEETVSRSTDDYRHLVRRYRDPVVRLENVVKAPFRRSRPGGPSRLIVREHLRLVETYPEEVRLADLPFKEVLVEMIVAAQGVGRFGGVDADDDAELINDFVRVRFHGLILGLVKWSATVEADLVWRFCLGALSRYETPDAHSGAGVGSITSINQPPTAQPRRSRATPATPQELARS